MGVGLVLAAASLGSCWAHGPPGRDRPGNQPEHLVDLTHTLSPAFPFIPIEHKTFAFRITPIATVRADGVFANRWELTEHNGTHLDAPSHFVEGAPSVEEIPIADTMFVPLAVVSIVDRAARDPDAALELADLEGWERAHGPIPERAAVFLYTGWEARVKQPARFVNMDDRGTMHFPGFSEQALDFLLTRRHIVGIGTDTLSIDPGRAVTYPAHKRLLATNKWAVECVAHLAEVPAVGASVLVAPLKVLGASGAPARVIAVW